MRLEGVNNKDMTVNKMRRANTGPRREERVHLHPRQDGNIPQWYNRTDGQAYTDHLHLTYKHFPTSLQSRRHRTRNPNTTQLTSTEVKYSHVTSTAPQCMELRPPNPRSPWSMPSSRTSQGDPHGTVRLRMCNPSSPASSPRGSTTTPLLPPPTKIEPCRVRGKCLENDRWRMVYYTTAASSLSLPRRHPVSYSPLTLHTQLHPPPRPVSAAIGAIKTVPS